MAAHTPMDSVMTALIDYITPVSVDTFGSYPGKIPGDKFEVMYHGKVYSVTVQPGDVRKIENGSMLRDFRYSQVEGPVTRSFVEDDQITRFLKQKRSFRKVLR